MENIEIPKRVKNILGETFGLLEVIEFDGIHNNQGFWICNCECDKSQDIRKKVRVSYDNLTRNHTKSCGCLKFQDLTGKIFGRLKVLSYEGESKWLCKCSCKDETIRVVRGANLKKKNGTKSCGCLVKEINSDTKTTHSMTKTVEYMTWIAMKSRCSNEENKRYGGRGIRVCDRWENSFENFLEDMKVRPSKDHSLDRLDYDGNYCKDNCRWATKEEQDNNKSTNVMIEFEGRTLSAMQWSKELNIRVDIIYYRIKHGWSVTATLKTPVNTSKRNDNVRIES